MAKTKKNKRITNHHKRVGAHQKRTPTFMKTYWPYIPMVISAGILIISGGFWTLSHLNVLDGKTGKTTPAINSLHIQQRINNVNKIKPAIKESTIPQPKGD